MTVSIESHFIDLALATANVLECSDCPERLRDALGDVASQLIENLSPSIAFELRALANAYPESKKSILAAVAPCYCGSESSVKVSLSASVSAQD
jgi:hypothetical protein